MVLSSKVNLWDYREHKYIIITVSDINLFIEYTCIYFARGIPTWEHNMLSFVCNRCKCAFNNFIDFNIPIMVILNKIYSTKGIRKIIDNYKSTTFSNIDFNSAIYRISIVFKTDAAVYATFKYSALTTSLS